MQPSLKEKCLPAITRFSKGPGMKLGASRATHRFRGAAGGGHLDNRNQRLPRCLWSTLLDNCDRLVLLTVLSDAHIELALLPAA